MITKTPEGLARISAAAQRLDDSAAQAATSGAAELELELSLRGSLLVQQQWRIVQLEDELQRAWAEIERLRSKLGALERERQPNDEDGQRQPRYWTPEEHSLFVEAVQRYGGLDIGVLCEPLTNEVKEIADNAAQRGPAAPRAG